MKYKAFLSYSHRDAKFARRLHRRVEGFAMPSSVLRKYGIGRKRPCSPIFRDRDELGADPLLRPVVMNALEQSEHLIVLCTPSSARSEWVATEIAHFLNARGPDNVIIAIAGDDPDAPGQSDISPSLLPPALHPLFDSGKAKVVDFREYAQGFVVGSVELSSALSGVTASELQSIDTRRRRRRMATIGAFVLAVSLLAVFSGFALVSAFQDWRSASQSTLLALNYAYTGITDLISLGYQQGPVTKITTRALNGASDRMQVFYDLPSPIMVGGGGDIVDMARLDIELERYRNYNLADDIDNAEAAARRAQNIDGILMARSRSALHTWFTRTTTGIDLNAEQSLFGQYDYQTKLALADVSGRTGDWRDAEKLSTAALAAARGIAAKPGASDADKIRVVEAMLYLAGEKALPETPDGGWTSGYTDVVAAIEDLPKHGDTGCCGGTQSWAAVRERYLAIAYIGLVGSAAARKDFTVARSSVSRTWEHLDRFEALSGNKAFAAILKADQLGYQIEFAATKSEWEMIESRAAPVLPIVGELASNNGDASWVVNPLANLLISLAEARARLGELTYEQPMNAALALISEEQRADSQNTTLRYSLGSMMGYAARVLSAANRCQDAMTARGSAIAVLNSIAARESHITAYWRRLHDIRALPVCTNPPATHGI